MNTQSVGATQVLFAGLLWGTSGTIASFFPVEASSLAIGAVRIAIGSLALVVFRMVSSRGSRGWPFTHSAHLPFPLLLVSAIGMAVTQVALFLSVRLAGVTIATMIFIGSSPLFGGVLSMLLRKERQTRSWLVSSLIVAAGCLGMAFSETFGLGSTGDRSTLLIGSLVALVAGLGWAVEGNCIKALQTYVPPLDSCAIVMLAGSVPLVPLAALEGFAWMEQPGSIPTALTLGIVSAAIPYLFFSLGMKRIPVAHAFLYGLIEPITASLLGIILLKERLNSTGMIGYGLVLGGLVLFSVWEAKSAVTGSAEAERTASGS
jgi:drug/metabolite transporter, DME family